MIEKKIVLGDISLTDFLGTGNQNINQLSSAFPRSQVISRGNEIMMRGNVFDLDCMTKIITQLLDYFNQYGTLTPHYVQKCVEGVDIRSVHKSDAILHGVKGVSIDAKTPNQKKLIDAVKAHDLVFVLGPAGTGKTYVSVALAVKALKSKRVKKIVITRPVVEAGERLGFLPGDLKDKVDPYLRPIYDALYDMMYIEKASYYLEKGIIEIVPLAYMRGRTLRNAFILVDEAQNTTPAQMRMVLTRMGVGSKMIVTGDLTQVDLPMGQTVGLEDGVRILSDVSGIGFVTLDHTDVMRHKLVEDIVCVYQNRTNSKD